MSNIKKIQFSSVIRNDDYIVRDHRVHGVRIMPGVTFIDMIYRGLRSHGLDLKKVELRNIVFKEPIATTEEYDKKIDISVEKTKKNIIIRAVSQKVKEGRVIAPEWVENFNCELHINNGDMPNVIDINSLKRGAFETIDIEGAYSYVRKIDIHHFEFMKGLGTIYKGKDYVLAQLHLSDIASEFLDYFYLHPAYLDASTLVPGAVLLNNDLGLPKYDIEDSRPFIPIFIESFKSVDSIKGECFVLVRNENVKILESDDLRYVDIELFKEDGTPAAVFKRLAVKKIRSMELIKNLETIKLGKSQNVSKDKLQRISGKKLTILSEAVTNTTSYMKDVKHNQSIRMRIEQDLIVMVAGILQKSHAEVKPEEGYYDQGLDSTSLLQLVQKLEEKLGEQLYPTLLFEYTNIRELTDFLLKEYAEKYTLTDVERLQKDKEKTLEKKPAKSIDKSVEYDLRVMISDITGKNVNDVSVDEGYYDQGLDSTNLLQLVQRLEEKLGEQLYPTLLFEYTNIKELANFIVKEYGDKYFSNITQKQDEDSTISELLYYQTKWEKTNINFNTSSTLLKGPILIFDYNNEVSDSIKMRLSHGKESGVQTIIVNKGDSFRNTNEDTYEINYRDIADYRKLIDKLVIKGIFPEKIVHLWSKGKFRFEEKELRTQLDTGIYSIFYLSKVLLEKRLKDKVQLLYIHQTSMHQTNDESKVQPLFAAVSGFAKTIRQENPKLYYKTIEVVTSSCSIEAERVTKIADIIAYEFSESTQNDYEIRYDEESRYVKCIEEYKPDIYEQSLTLKDGGVYLITGGAGGLGLIFAEYIAKSVNSKIILTGRSKLSEDKKKKIKELEVFGSNIKYIETDISNRNSVKELIKSIITEFKQINGVIHSAGVIKDSFIAKKTTSEIEDVLAPKVFGTIWLDEALANEKSDFFVMFSSTAAVMGNMGQSDYSFASSFMDYYAEKRKQEKRPGLSISINWPLWNDGGMKVDEQVKDMLFAKTGIVPLSIINGEKVFEEALRQQNSQIMVIEGIAERIRSLPVLKKGTTLHEAVDFVEEASYDLTGHRENSPYEDLEEDKIAIIGVSGRYPMAKNMEEYWNNLINRKDCITEIPKSRWDYNEYFDENKDQVGTSYSKWGGFIDDVDKFDPLFFNISPKEAEFLDPQERLFLQTVWHAIEDAGYTKAALSKYKVGVYVGIMWAQYQLLETEINGKNISPMAFYASVANRVSYYFNFHGPSMAVDTMCSSALTAVHLACESIRRGESDIAVAGGVNLTIHPGKYIFLSMSKMASSDGRCRSFGEGGDGYVPGEGVGAVILKPLKKAISDGDQIYAVIKGSSINSGGKTSGFTVPSPIFQAEVIGETFSKAGVKPGSIGYLETHGTGTSLGDPIEINGLVKAFGDCHGEKQFCAIGSIKSNIGHLESAAGVAAITKVLLQLKHRKIVPSLHSEKLNPNINFKNSPFYVQQELTDWKQRVINQNGIEFTYPRRAGISSFGAGGSNAHIILEEYIEAHKVVKEYENIRLVFVVSARNSERLRTYVAEMLEFFENENVQDAINNNTGYFSDIAYTLQVGREEMDERLAVVASNITELRNILKSYNQGGSQGIYAGSIKTLKNKDNLLDEEDHTEEIKEAILSKDMYKLAQLWVFGAEIDWNLLYTGKKTHRVSLPLYPFAKESYWACELGKVKSSASGVLKHADLHPLIDSNESTLEEQCFKKHITKNDCYLKDHIVERDMVLPGVIYLEMARVAAELSNRRKKVSKLKNVVWAKPIVLSKPSNDMYMSLYPEGKIVRYEASTVDNEGTRTVHSYGEVYFSEFEKEKSLFSDNKIDIEMLKSLCEDKISGDECYRRFDEIGFAYGKSLQVIKTIYCGRDKVLSLLEVPKKEWSEKEDFVLHPGIMDGALQTVAGLLSNMEIETNLLYMPYSIGEISISGQITDMCYAYASVSCEDSIVSNTDKKFNIIIADEQGNVLVSISNFSLRAVYKNIQSTTLKSKEVSKSLVYYTKLWEQSEIKSSRGFEKDKSKLLIFDTNRNLYNLLLEKLKVSQVTLVVPGKNFRQTKDGVYEIRPDKQDDYLRLFDSLKSKKSIPGRIIHKWSDKGFSFDKDEQRICLQRGVYSLFCMSKALVSKKIQDKINILYMYRTKNGETQPQYAAVNAFSKVIGMENPNIMINTLELQDGENLGDILTVNEIVEIILTEFGNMLSAGSEIRYLGKARSIGCLKEINMKSEQKTPLPVKEKGVYIITGGTGGLGIVFAEYLASRFKARLVLVGRSELSSDKMAAIKRLELLGSEVMYLRADISERNDVQKIINETKLRFNNGVDGIIHSAGIIRDSLLKNKGEEDFESVIASKVFGTIWLDEASREEKLDFFATFSSTASIVGNVGQCDYAFANSYMDYYMQLRSLSDCQGKSLSIIWPLWRDGGMHVSEELTDILEKETGILPLSNEEGIRAFEYGLKSELTMFTVLEGDGERIRKAMSSQLGYTAENTDEKRACVSVDSNAKNLLKMKVEEYIKNILSEEIKLPIDKIDLNEPFESYGIDSVGVMNLTRTFEKSFGQLPKTLFYEYKDINGIAEYFIEKQLKKAMDIFGETQEGKQQTFKQVLKVEKQEPTIKRSRFSSSTFTASGNTSISEDIAIIGLSGRYPKADNLKEFWKNLKEGRDCITEIPEDRWNYSDNFDTDKGKKGKVYSKWGGFINDVDKFDSLFFNISPIESQVTDPQERLFLETVWKTIEDAGYTRRQLEKQTVGVFVGVMYSHYQLYGIEETLKGNPMALTSSHASIANRVSYFFNFCGPSIGLDTMCSSSLTSIHLACESIRRGESDLAVAGGVNLSLHSNKYLLLSQGKFVSTDGKCRSFGEGGDGYVPGEGVGAVLLKPVSTAVSDGDHIYAVIKGTSINHGGKTNGYTVPNPNAQSMVISSTLRKTGINPRTISYIEAHGTGTSLGDPIEIAGLMRSFGDETSEKQYCSIGSVKSNIGHLESAAGIAGLTKVLLQMKYKELVPSIHSHELNRNIDFDNSPFYVQREVEEWKKPVIEENFIEREYQRRAGISSFGAGGANAHIILEEYEENHSEVYDEVQYPHVVVLSARDDERLKEYAWEVLNFIKSEISGKEGTFLDDLAYTLQLGREGFESRLAAVVSSIDELVDIFEKFCSGKLEIENFFYAGNSNKPGKKYELLIDGKEGEEFVKTVINERKFAKLALLWVNGADVDWNLLYQGRRPKRISLPTYPFAKDRYWVPQTDKTKLLEKNNRKFKTLHPLVDSNTSTLRTQKFTKVFSANEFYIEDHIIFGEKILPGVVYLEMARASGEMAGEANVKIIRDIIWKRPLSFKDEVVEVDLELYPDGELVDFEVVSEVSEGQKIIYTSGKLFFENYQTQNIRSEVINIGDIKKRMNESISKEEIYSKLGEIGLRYGERFQGIKMLYANESEALSQIELPVKLIEGFKDYILHPSLMDAALQTVAGITGRTVKELYLPYSLSEMNIMGSLKETCYVYVTLNECAAVKDTSVKKLNILITDESGQVLVSMKEFTLREYRQALKEATIDSIQELEYKNSNAKYDDENLIELLQKVKNGQLDANEADRLMEGAYGDK